MLVGASRGESGAEAASSCSSWSTNSSSESDESSGDGRALEEMRGAAFDLEDEDMAAQRVRLSRDAFVGIEKDETKVLVRGMGNRGIGR